VPNWNMKIKQTLNMCFLGKRLEFKVFTTVIIFAKSIHLDLI